MRRFLLRSLNGILIAALALTSAAPVLAQAGGEDAFIADFFPRMSPEAKIGQLFIVAFDGADASDTSDIADLILTYHVGGVVLSADHGNIVDNGDQTPLQVARLTASLQQLAARPAVGPASFIPLFIALEQDGGGPAYSAITSGLTPQPSPMALGATWNTDDAQAVGRVVGDELSALGINFLLGPSLDVLSQPDPRGGDSGVRAFGGDPYWVGALAGAFVRGLREGSGGRIAVALKHFPGEGGVISDPDTKTIDKSLDQLVQIDLAPYFELMRVPQGDTRPLADAVMTSHARYRGFQGRLDRTDPISVDAGALDELLTLPAASVWRGSGGVMVSGSLGDEALRRFYDPTLSTFPAVQIALDAFLSGNDILILNDFSLTQSVVGERETIKAVISAFQQRYLEDLDFQARVDSAVKRILRLKYRLYPGFQAADAIASSLDLDTRLRQGLPEVERVAQDALTRVYPTRAQLEAAPLPIPALDNRFLVFTDDRFVFDCRQCPERTTLFTTVISSTLTRIAGVPPEQITSLGFADLKSFLGGAPLALDLTDAFAQADWIILAQQDIQAGVQQSDAARQLLRDRPELLAGKRVTLFAFGPPYQLSADELRPITAGYYAAYSIGQPFVDAAIGALFGILQPIGASPVSISAVDYDLATQIEPDPNQIIRLFVGGVEPGPDTPTPTPVSLRVEDEAQFRTDTIVDRNGNPVPDGTPVKFTLVYRDAGDATEKIDALTVGGIATIAVQIKTNGRMELSAVSEPALNSVRLQVTIVDQGPTVIQTIERPLPTPTRMPTATPTRMPTATATPTPIALVDSLLGAEPRRANLIDLALSLLGVTLVGAWGYRVESRRKREDAVDRAVRLVLWGSLCGLAAYTGYALGLPGADALRNAFGGWTALIVTLVGAIAPWLFDRIRQRAG